MPHHHLIDDDAPRDRRWTPRIEHEVLAAARDRILQLDVDGNGNVHRREVLDALDDESDTR